MRPKELVAGSLLLQQVLQTQTHTRTEWDWLNPTSSAFIWSWENVMFFCVSQDSVGLLSWRRWNFLEADAVIWCIIHDNDTLRFDIRQKLFTEALLKARPIHFGLVVTSSFGTWKARSIQEPVLTASETRAAFLLIRE